MNYKFIAGIHAVSGKELDRVAAKVTVDSIMMAQTEFKGFLRESFKLFMSRHANLDKNIFWVSASLAGSETSQAVEYHLEEVNGVIKLFPTDKLDGAVADYVYKKMMFERKAKPALTEDQEAIAEAAAATHEQVSAEAELFEEFMTTDMTIEEYSKAQEEISAASETLVAEENNKEEEEMLKMTKEQADIVTAATTRLVENELHEAGKEVNDQNVIAWITANTDRYRELEALALKQIELQVLVATPGFKKVVDYLKDVFKAVDSYLVKTAFQGFRTKNDGEAIDAINKLEEAFEGDYDKISDFIKGHMGALYGITFKGMYMTGVVYTANTVSTMGKLHKLLFHTVGDVLYYIGDLGEKGANMASEALLKHAGVDPAEHTNPMNEGLDRFGNAVKNTFKKGEEKKA